MSLTLVLLAIATAEFLVAPHLLGRGSWRIRHPESCLLAWYAMFVTGVACTCLAVIRAVVRGMSAQLLLQHRDWVSPTTEVMSAWLALAIAGAALSLLGTKLGAMIVRERQLRADFARLAEHADTRHQLIDGLSVHLVASAEVVVCSLRRSSGEVMLSTAVTDRLSGPQVSALLAHERAHLRGLHDVISRVAALNADCLPGFLTPARMEQSTRLLIELAADRAAARRVGRRTMIDTLTTMAGLWNTDVFLLRAELLGRGGR